MACSALQLISTQRATLDPILERMRKQDLAAGRFYRRRQRVLPALDAAPRAVAERCLEQAAPVRPRAPLFHAGAHRPIDHHAYAANSEAPRPCLDGLRVVGHLLESEDGE